ncbi:MAG: CRTAC1 family protein, partial [Phycisphaerae bacterium]|nr:CRTAC1 family protein [Phycisphaerae bacterium]
NRAGIGAVVSLETSRGTLRRWLSGGGPFQSNLRPEAHFGLPSGAGPLTIEVLWPDGLRQRIEDVRPGQVLEVVRAEPAAE